MSSDRPQSDEWDQHWESFGGLAVRNPANRYRRKMIHACLGNLPPVARVLDIGSGQGDLAVELKARFPSALVRGLEASAEGVRRARLMAQARAVDVEFEVRDLLADRRPPTSERGWATHAVCSEVLEHLDDPMRLLDNVQEYLAPGAPLVITVPGGPRTAFDKHIGHRRHYTPDGLRRLLGSAGYEVDGVRAAGFPFFNLYKLAVAARGTAVVADLSQKAERSGASLATGTALRLFGVCFYANLPATPWGWQLVAAAHLRHQGR